MKFIIERWDERRDERRMIREPKCSISTQDYYFLHLEMN
jgi:hypothetical protein